jgi:hypothetical protein
VRCCEAKKGRTSKTHHTSRHEEEAHKQYSMFRKKKQQQRKRTGPPGAVGTEAVAKRNLELNRVDFRYPISGFEHQIEHTLIYNMLSSPEIYPDSAIRTAIREEDFGQYMLVAEDSTRNKKEGDEDEHLYSYSQLSALLTLTADKWPGEQKEWNDGTKDESIPQILCRTLLRIVVRHAEEHELDR